MRSKPSHSKKVKSASRHRENKLGNTADSMADVLRSALSANLSILFITNETHVLKGQPTVIGRDYIRFEMLEPPGTQIVPLNTIKQVLIHDLSRNDQ